jgi:hypothetical protein
LIRYERLVTPAEHLGVLVEPAGRELHATLDACRARRFDDVRLLDTTLGALRTQLRARLNLTPPVIVTGHQTEFFHAGVFAKTIAADTLARRIGGQAAFLAVDSDVPKTAQLAVPQVTSRGVRRVEVPIPGCDLGRPFEAQPRAARADWLQFFAGVTSLCEWGDRSLLPAFARAWLTGADASPAYCDALLRAHAATETALGLPGAAALRMSHLCQTPEFRVFVAALLLNARRHAEQYNAAQAAYRQRHRIRARGRPVPPLAIDERGVELPLWAQRPDEPRRRLFAAPREGAIELLADDISLGTLPRDDLARTAVHADPWPLERAGWQLRPRALALSAFARLFLADLFIHGIGGAKYDEVMEESATAFFGVAPVPACCVSATVHLPLPHSNVRLADIAAARHQCHDLRHNPQRHLPGVPDELLQQRAELIRRGLALRAHEPHNHAGRQLVFSELHRLNERLLAADPWRAAQYDQRVHTLATQWQADRVALDREYFYALHLQTTLAELTSAVQHALTET